MINVKDIRYSIEGLDILKGIDLKIEKGKFYGILGPNGCGKTTFLDIISGVITNYQGEINIKDKNIRKTSKKEIAKSLALVPQNFDTAFPFSVEEILNMGRYPHRKKFSVLNRKDKDVIDGIIDELELEEMLDSNITDLSGGERQRVMFGKALIQETDILLLDESTSNLDPYYAHSLLTKVRERVEEKGLTVISVFHDFNLASLYCDEIIFLKNGTVEASGETLHTLTPENIKRVFNIKSRVIEDFDKKFIVPYL